MDTAHVPPVLRAEAQVSLARQDRGCSSLIRAPVASGNDGWLAQTHINNSNPFLAYTSRGNMTFGALPKT